MHESKFLDELEKTYKPYQRLLRFMRASFLKAEITG